ncbi:MAG: aminomethyl-transferring glycine dehydrogenase subunit GcvPB [Candidatus Hydrogenedentota bacterium]|nr:MAG: aminomethyl-transferring glycine dehydrogenase subunit GcvPB [Candidatus Hydrogenedentota bacterium]
MSRGKEERDRAGGGAGHYRTELEVVRRFVRLSRMNFSVDGEFYPLGSCTMKYNPKICDTIASLPGLRDLHPFLLESSEAEEAAFLRGVLSDLSRMLGLLTGMKAFALSPAAGAHGELTGCLLIRRYHEENGEGHRNEMLIPDSAHGTNPASAVLAGFKVVSVKTAPDGCVDIEDLRGKIRSSTAGMMMTNPNTLGLFEARVEEIARLVHGVGGLMYYDGANLNALVGWGRIADMGFDLCHLNLHKTFAVPHGGGGPGAGPVGAAKHLAELLPGPLFEGDEARFPERSIGRVIAYGGNIGALVRAYVYLRLMGLEGLRRAARDAVLAANYLRVELKEDYPSPYSEYPCAHECLLSAARLKKERGLTALDVAKGLIEHHMHPPTIYFPLLVSEALLIEPTESECLETLDDFVRVMKKIARSSPEEARTWPTWTPVSHPDEARAARRPVIHGPLRLAL